MKSKHVSRVVKNIVSLIEEANQSDDGMYVVAAVRTILKASVIDLDEAEREQRMINGKVPLEARRNACANVARVM